MRSLALSDLRDAAREELAAAIAKIKVGGDPTKAVLVEPRLRQSLDATGLSAAFSEQAGVKMVRALDVRVLPSADVRSVVLVVRPQLALMKDVATIINVWNAFQQTYHFHVLFVPKRTFICSHMLQNEYRLSSKYERRLEISEVEIDFFVVEDDVLSMEQPGLFRDLFMEGDTTALQYIAKALVKLQTAKIGLVPKVIAKGNVATRTLDFMRRMISDVGVDYMQEQASLVDRLLILDRGVDLATPMVTQRTYEGMLDDTYGIKCGVFTPPFDVSSGLKPQHNGKATLTNTSDEIFEALRDLPFAGVGAVLHQKSLSVKADYDRRQQLELREFGKFIKQVPERHRLVTLHTAIAKELTKLMNSPGFRRRVSLEQNALLQSEEKEVLEYVEELMNKGEPMVSVLRYLCLLSVANGGLKPKLYDSLKEQFMMSYGVPQTLAGWYNLDRAGLLTKNTTGLLDRAGQAARGLAGGDRGYKAPFGNLRKACRLWVEDPKQQQDDLSYSYAGYAPLLLRTVQGLETHAGQLSAAARSAASAAADSSSSPMTKLERSEPLTSGIPAVDQTEGGLDVLVTGAEVAGSTETVLVFVIGGVTASEVSAIRTILGTDTDGETGTRTDYIVMSTSIITGDSLLESVLPVDK